MGADKDDIIWQATKLCQDENESEAEHLLKNALLSHPEELELMTKLGEIQVRLCKDQEAESTFRSVLRRDPHLEDAVCGLGRLLDQALRTEEAEQLYRNFILTNPNGHCAIEDLCRLLISENRIDEAESLARDNVQKHRGTVNAYNALRYVLHFQEDHLESDLNDDRRNETIFHQLVDNLFEQLDLVVTLESRLKPQEDLLLELKDDKTRLISELQHLFDSSASRKISISEQLHHRILEYK